MPYASKGGKVTSKMYDSVPAKRKTVDSKDYGWYYHENAEQTACVWEVPNSKVCGTELCDRLLDLFIVSDPSEPPGITF